MLSRMVCLIDQREQQTELYRRRVEALGIPSERTTLSYADYSAYTTDEDGNIIDLRTVAGIERKQNLGELSSNFTSGRQRFKREFERAKADGCRMHIIIEEDNYERLYAHKYRSKLSPQALNASLLTWSIRYDFKVHFCKKETTGRLIAEIMHYELREYLLNQTEDMEIQQ